MVTGFRPVLTLLLLALSWEEVVGRCTQSCPSAPGCTHLSDINNGYCGSTSYRQVSRQRSRYNTPHYSEYYYTSCGFLGWDRCRRSRDKSRSVLEYYTYYLSERVCSQFCCSGYTGSAPSCKVPGAVSSLSVASYSSTYIRVSWSSPAYPNGVLTSYYWYITDVVSGISHTRSGYTSNHYVMIIGLHEGVRYRIDVYARNGAGTGSSSSVYGTTSVIRPTGPPLGLTATEGSNLDITIRWSPPTILAQNGPISGYKVYWNGGSVTTSSTSRSFTSLSPYTTYTFSVAAINAAGEASSSNRATTSDTTRQTAPSDPPTNVRTTVTKNSITIAWSPPSSSQRNGVITGYSVYLGSRKVATTTQLVYTIRNLSSFTDYSVTVSAITVAEGPKHLLVAVKTLEDVPNAPPANCKVQAGSDAIHTTWDPVPANSRNGIIRGYNVQWGEGLQQMISRSVDVSQESFCITDLDLNADYSVVVNARTNVGSGVEATMEVTTTRQVLHQVTALTAAPQSPTSVFVQWGRPQDYNVCLMKGFIIKYRSVTPFILHSASIEVSIITFNLVLNNLQEHTTYVICVAVTDSFGHGQEEFFNVTTNEAAPCGGPLHLKVQVTSTSATSTWEPPEPIHRNGRITRYSCQLKGSGVTLVTTPLCEFTALKPHKTYTVYVAAFTSKGSGPTANLTFSTAEGAPFGYPLNIKALPTDSSLEIVWSPLLNGTTNGRIIGYTVCWNDNSVNVTHRKYIISGLAPCTEYPVTVSACTSAGHGPKSPVEIFRTTENDIDECALDTDRCEQLCKDTQGSYNCSCRDGYSLAPDDVSCLRSCPPLPKIPHSTFTTVGSLESDLKSVALYACDWGYQITLDNGKTTFIGRTECVESSWSNLIPCQNIDECARAASKGQICHPDKSVCIDSDGGYECRCNLGYERGSRNNSECTDLNECLANPFPCDHLCRNDFGTYTCRCKEGYELLKDESTCKKTTPKTCPDLIAPPSVRVRSVLLPTGHRRADLTCREEFAEFPTDVDPTPQYCIDGYWTHQIQGYEIPNCESPEDPSVNLIPGLTLKGSKKTCGTSGSIIKSNQCYQCSPGSYLNTTTRYPLCQFCPTDTYQSERGQTECIACPEGTQTRSAGSNSSELCVGLCTPGSFSRDGLTPCTLCPVGFYQPNASSDYCFQCDCEYVTIEAGAARKSQCGCPRGTYGQQCNETCSCLNGGTCLDDGSCKCTIWWTGYECSVPANFDQTCPDNICYPGVDCLRTSGTDITCGDCPEGMDGNGINCTTRCPPRSCHPAVSCFVDENGIAHCGDCPDGYSGNGSSTCTKLPQESKSFGITFPKGFKDADKCVVFFSSNISFDPTLDILEVGSDLNNFTDHVDVNGNISHVNLPSEHARSVTKLTVPQGRSIGVLGIVWERATADVYMSYPYPETQPLKFIAVSVPTSKWVLLYKLSGFIFVSAEHDNTQVNISATVDIEVKNNDQSVDGAQTAYVLSHNTRLEILSNFDLTGTVITSNKPVAVISGHSCGNVPYNVTGCDQLVEEMPPVHTWGTEFIVSTFERRSRGDYLKLVTSQETTVSLFCGRSENVTYRLNALAHVLHFLPSGVSCFVRSSQPIIIAQFSVASTWSDDSGDPSMTVVPHLDQYQPNLTFYSPEICGISGYNHYVNVYYIAQVGSGTSMGRQEVMRDLNISDIEVMPDDVHRIPSRDKHSVHFVIKLPINPGVHTVSSRRGSIAALVYGANRFEFYSYSVYHPIAPAAEI